MENINSDFEEYLEFDSNSSNKPQEIINFKNSMKLKEIIKCGEVIAYNSDNFYYLCKSCNIEILINNSMEFLQHIKNDISKELVNIEYLDVEEPDVDELEFQKSETIKIEKIDLLEEFSNPLSHSDHSANEDDTLKSEKIDICKTELDDADDDKTSDWEGKFECEICKMIFCRKQAFIDHQNIHTDSPHKCSQCSASFKHQTTLSNHRKVHKHPNSEICKKCKRAFISGKYHPCSALNVTGSTTDSKRNNSSQDYKCLECREVFPSEIRLKEHNIYVHNALGYSCDVCGKTLKYLQSYRDHMTEHSNETYPCKECDRVFQRRDTLKSHIIKEHLKRHECKFCNKTCYSAADLRAHESMHTGIKALQCEICGRKFPRNNQLKMHIQRHLNLLEYHCDQCPKRFNTERQLTEHKLWHSDERNYHCKICTQSFKTSNSLRRHVKIHSKQPKHPCQYCDSSFVLRIKLKEHIKQYHPNILV